MDLKKILFFLFWCFFILSLGVFADSSIYGIENITGLPWDAEGKDFILAYSSDNKHLYIAINRSNIEVKSFHVSEEGVHNESGNLLTMHYREYMFDENRWSPIVIFDDNIKWLTEQGLNPVFSTKNVYHNGQVYIYGRNFDRNMGFFSGLTSSVIFSSILKPIMNLVPYVLAFIVLLLAFIKAWNFVKGAF